MTGYNTFRCYQALKLHFTREEYDFQRYHGKTTTTLAAFQKRNDVSLFEFLGRRKNVQSFLVANLSKKAYYVKTLVSDPECEKNYNDWLKVRTALNYQMKSELSNLGSFEQEFGIDGGLPSLFRRYVRKEISRETFILMVYHSGQYDVWDAKLKGVLLWEAERLYIKKYFPFVLKKSFIVKQLIDKWPQIEYNSPVLIDTN